MKNGKKGKGIEMVQRSRSIMKKKVREKPRVA